MPSSSLTPVTLEWKNTPRETINQTRKQQWHRRVHIIAGEKRYIRQKTPEKKKKKMKPDVSVRMYQAHASTCYTFQDSQLKPATPPHATNPGNQPPVVHV